MQTHNFCLIKARKFQITQNFFKKPHTQNLIVIYVDTIFVPYLPPRPSILSGWKWHKTHSCGQTEMTSKQEKQSKESEKCVHVLPAMLQDTEDFIAALS